MEFITPYHIIAILVAYLAGSIPTAVWVGKRFFGVDVRKEGSGNSGATNTFRVLGAKAGVPVLLFDVLKGWLPVFLFSTYGPYQYGTDAFVNLQIAVGMAAVLGHVFSLFLRFKGGKGVATLLGMIIAIQPIAALICMGVFLIMFLASKYVSLGSITAAVLFPVVIILVLGIRTPSLVYFSAIIAVLVVVTHHKNIGRLIKKEENKVQLKRGANS